MRFYIRLYEWILARRYKVKIIGLEHLTSHSPKLFLPNHVSHIDPQLISDIILKHTALVPLVAERFFKVPVIRYFLRKMDAVRVFEPQNLRKSPGMMQAIRHKLNQAFKENKSVLIFPAGQLSEGGVERIHSKQSAYSIVQDLPVHADIIGVRIRGLWGSMFSKAWNGKRPVFLTTYLLSILIFFVNLIFLCPRRKVSVEFVQMTHEAKLKAQEDRKSFNLFLEDFYNACGPEPPNFVRHFFFLPRFRRTVAEVIRA